MIWETKHMHQPYAPAIADVGKELIVDGRPAIVTVLPGTDLAGVVRRFDDRNIAIIARGDGRLVLEEVHGETGENMYKSTFLQLFTLMNPESYCPLDLALREHRL